MKYERILRKVMFEPWLITKPAHASIISLIESKFAKSIDFESGHATSPNLNPFAARPKEDFFGDALPQMEIDKDRIATIPIKGIIGQGFGTFEKSCGAVDTQDIIEELDTAVARGARAVILDIDSPGGTVNGTPELADKLSQIQADGPPVYTFTNSLIASAAYWIGSTAAGGIYTTKSADIGSIGVYLPWIDRSKAFEAMGYKVEIIKAGKLKATGYPGTQLTEDQRAHLQQGVDDIYKMFTDHVRAWRGQVDDSVMQGQTFLADKAKEAGLIDGVVQSIADVKAKILKSR